MALAPGRYVILGPSEGWARSEGWPHAVSVTLPPGWTIDTRVRGSVLRGINGTGANGTQDVRLDFWSVDNLLADTCSRQFGGPMVDPLVGPTGDDLLSALTAWPVADVTAPANVTVGGFSGMQLELVVPADAPGCDEHQVWFSPPSHGVGGRAFYVQPGWRHQVSILDVDGLRFVVNAAIAPGASPDAVAELRQVVASIGIQP